MDVITVFDRVTASFFVLVYIFDVPLSLSLSVYPSSHICLPSPCFLPFLCPDEFFRVMKKRENPLDDLDSDDDE